MSRYLLLAAVAAFAGWAPSAQADDCDPAVLHFWKADGLATTRVGAAKMADMCFSAADTNGDGMVDSDEWSNFFGSLFDSADSDKNGEVSQDEINQLQSRE